MQAKLRRLAHRANEKEDAQNIHCLNGVSQEADSRSAHARRSGKDFTDRYGVEHQVSAEYPEHEAKVAHAVDDESLDSSRASARFPEPEPDQQIGREANAFPTEEHLNQIICRHQHQHGEREQREIGEETRLVRVFVHIAPAI